MVFCNKGIKYEKRLIWEVTILILIDGFLQFDEAFKLQTAIECHNPYFNRWFSAI